MVLLSCVWPLVEYGAEVWYPPTSRGSQLLAKIDQLQLDIIRCVLWQRASLHRGSAG
jgi:hypothetical protein